MNAASKETESEIELLLPWYAAGTLNSRDARRVEETLARDPELARRYALVRDELAETIALNENLGAPSSRAMEALFTKIDAEPARRVAVAGGLGARISEFFASLTPRTLAYASGAAAIALLLQAGIIGGIVLKDQGAARYQTASTTSSQTSTGAFALMRFAPQAAQSDVTAFLANNKLSIVAGPMNGGLYRVKIASETLAPEQLAARIKSLQDDKIVGFIASTQ